MRKRTKKKSPVKAAQPLLDARKSEELLGLLLILFGLLLAIGLISYQGENPQEVTANLVRNQLGIAGVYLSWALIHGTIGFPVNSAWSRSFTILRTTRVFSVFSEGT